MSTLLNSELLLHLWQSSLFALAACALLIVFRKGSTWSRHFIAWAAYLKFLVPLALISDLVHALFSKGEAVTIPALEDLPPVQALSTGLDLSYWLNQDSVAETSGLSIDFGLWGVLLVVGTWAIGTLYLFVRRWSQYRRIHTSLANDCRVADEKWTDLAQSILGSRKVPTLLISRDQQLNGGVFGVVSSKIVIPEKMDTFFEADDRDAFLRHELQHVLKYDNLWLFLQKCIRDFFWFHPLVCWLDRQISWEREMMRDEEVLNKTKNKNTYLNCLMKASKIDLPQNYATSVGLTGSPFSRRIKAIAAYRPTIVSKLVSGFISVVAIALLAGMFTVSINSLQAGYEDREDPVDVSLRNARLGLEAKLAGDMKVEPKLNEAEKQLIRGILPLVESDREEVKRRLITSIDEDTSAAIFFLIGNFYVEDEDVESALLYYEGAIERFPDFARAHKNLGFLSVQQGNFEKGKKHLLKVYSWNHNEDSTLCGLIGLCYVKLEEYATAEIYYRQAIDFDPSVADWKVGLAKALLNQSKYEEAIPVLEEAKAIRGDDGVVYNPLGDFGALPQP